MSGVTIIAMKYKQRCVFFPFSARKISTIITVTSNVKPGGPRETWNRVGGLGTTARVSSAERYLHTGFKLSAVEVGYIQSRANDRRSEK